MKADIRVIKQETAKTASKSPEAREEKWGSPDDQASSKKERNKREGKQKPVTRVSQKRPDWVDKATEAMERTEGKTKYLTLL